jgi:ribosomal protein S18 acetylase RimI-like enzyme
MAEQNYARPYDAGGEFLVGELDDSTVVAMGAFQPATAVDHHADDPCAAVIRRMRVDPEHQRRGYGSTALEKLERRADERGFERLVLDTTPRQEAAIALYRSFGYVEARRRKTSVGTMVYFEKELYFGYHFRPEAIVFERGGGNSRYADERRRVSRRASRGG